MQVGRAATLLGALLLAAWQAPAWAAAPGLRTPERLTAGGSDEFLGSLSPDGQTLYFISNRNATTQVFAQALAGGTPNLVFEEGADATFARPSPDGTTLAYISTRDDATGDVCLRELPAGKRRCLTGPDTSDANVFWFPDGQSLGVVSRRGMHGDLELRRIDRGAQTQEGTLLLREGVSSPALHPDGRWLAFVPVERASTDVGIAFAMRPAKGLRLVQLGAQGHQEVTLPLPGVTGFPAFSVDGHYLYFAQNLSDTNFDGRIDGHDHSVLFRIRFDPSAPHPIATTVPEQLTSARWDCQYPAPTRGRLIATCHVEGSLDLYSLPLEGAVAPDWSPAKLREVLSVSRDPWQQLLVLSHLVARAAGAERIGLLREMTRIHLKLGELASASFHAQAAAASAKEDGAVQGWATVVGELVGHRRDELRLSGGQLDDTFLGDQRARVRRLGRLLQNPSAAVRDFARLAQVEVLDVMGEEGRALQVLDGVKLGAVEDPFVLHAFAERGLGLLRSTGRRDALLKALAALAEHEALDGVVRVDFAEQVVAELERGVGLDERKAAIAAWGTRFDRGGELGFRLALEAQLLALTPQSQEDVRAAIFKLYKQNDAPERRRALVAATCRRAAEIDNAYLLYEFSNTWVSQVRRDNAERDAAVDLYRQIVLDKAWIHNDKAEFGDARGTFWGLTLQTDDLEAHAGFLEARLREGKQDGLDLYRQRFGATPDDPVLHFAEAWMAARELPRLRSDAERNAAFDRAEGHARAAATALSQSPGLSQLRGYLAQERFLLLGDRQAGVTAVDHHQMALDLARGRPRYEASILSDLALLQSQLGNHALALGAIDRRRLLPMRDAAEALSLRLARARSLMHVGRAREASAEAEAALADAEAKAELASLRPLALDRAALMAYAAGDAKLARSHYEALCAAPPLTRQAGLDRANQMRWALMAGAAAAADGDHAAALRWLDQARQGLARLGAADLAEGSRTWSHSPDLGTEDFTLIVQGLSAHSARSSGQGAQARTELLDRQAGLESRLAQRPDEDGIVLDLAENQYRLALVARDAGDGATARVHLEQGLRRAAEFGVRTGTVASDVRLDLLRAYAEGLLSGRLGPGAATAAYESDLREVHTFLCARANPARAAERFVLGVYLTLLELAHHKPASPAGGTP